VGIKFALAKGIKTIYVRRTIKIMIRYFRVFILLSYASFQTFLASRIGAVLFLAGKILRFIFFLTFLVVLVAKTQVLAGYNLWQVLLFYLTFNFIDAATQMLFREVYRFRQQIITGNFDLVLVKPVNSLFRALFGGTDLLDLVTLFPFIIFIGIAVSRVADITFIGILLYCLLVLNSLFIAASFHIMVLALAILTTEIDHAVMIYRDLSTMGRLPVDIYSEPLRSFITFVIPIGIMMAFPAKALMGVLSLTGIFTAFGIGITVFSLSLFLWRYALRYYTSASS